MIIISNHFKHIQKNKYRKSILKSKNDGSKSFNNKQMAIVYHHTKHELIDWVFFSVIVLD